jgi:hypothetical protein
MVRRFLSFMTAVLLFQIAANAWASEDERWVERGVRVFFGFLRGRGVAQSVQQRTYDWTYYNERYSLDVPLANNAECQRFYGLRRHDWNLRNRYISGDHCIGSVIRVAHRLRELGEQDGLDKAGIINLGLNFVYAIPYRDDQQSAGREDYARYPSETLLDGSGDCEDHALLYAALLSQWCVSSALLIYPSHVAVGIRSEALGSHAAGIYYSTKGLKYFLAEPTGCPEGDCGEREVGEEDERHQRQNPVVFPIFPLCAVPLRATDHGVDLGPARPAFDDTAMPEFLERPR